MSRLTFVVGKGGVGKTTVSCAYALHLAASKPRESILLMSTDPAHSLADVLQQPVQSNPKKLTHAKGKLFAWQIDAGKEFRKFLSGNRDAILNIVESGTFFSREEIAPLLDTTLPGMAEVAGLLAIQQLLEDGEHKHIIVDTAPFGHTLRLFELPSHFQRFLNFLNVASSRDAILAQHFGGHVDRPAHAFLERWEKMVRQVRDAFTSRHAEIFLVTSPETFSLNEAARSLQSLEQSVPDMGVSAIVLNRVVHQAKNCASCSHRVRMAAKAQQFLKREFPSLPILLGPDPGNPILGPELLRRFGRVVFKNRAAKLEVPPPTNTKTPLQFNRQKWPVPAVALSFTIGKGGVGKTTMTAALAFHSRAANRKMPVTVCSTDPAPSLDDVFEQEIGDSRVSVLRDPKFTAMEIDSVSEFRRWTQQITRKLNAQLSTEAGGLHVDLTFEKEVFAALMDVVPPGVDEVFAIFRILDLVRQSGRTFIDMAPTGHALELLRMPERIQHWSRLLLKSLAAHRTLALAQDVAVELASLGQQVRRLIAIMKDPQRSRIWAVMLPEPVPDHQTGRLLAAIREMGIQVDSLFVNRVLIREERKSTCKHCARAWKWQLHTLRTLKKKYGKYRTFLAPEFPAEIAGTKALGKFTSELWQIAN